MKSALLLLVITTLAACGGKQYDVPAEFQPYVDSFKAAGKAEGLNITVDNLKIEFEAPNGNEGAECVTGINPPTIKVDSNLWANATDETVRESMMFHELGHCVLMRVHDNTTIDAGDLANADGSVGSYDGQAASIMNPYIVWGGWYSLARAGLIHEMFHSGDYSKLP